MFVALVKVLLRETARCWRIDKNTGAFVAGRDSTKRRRPLTPASSPRTARTLRLRVRFRRGPRAPPDRGRRRRRLRLRPAPSSRRRRRNTRPVRRGRRRGSRRAGRRITATGSEDASNRLSTCRRSRSVGRCKVTDGQSMSEFRALSLSPPSC